MSKICSVYLLKYLPSISKSLRGKNKRCEEKNLVTSVVAKGMETEILLIQTELQNLDGRKYLSNFPHNSSCNPPNVA